MSFIVFIVIVVEGFGMYNYLIVGAGLYGAVYANQLVKRGESVLVIDKRSHIGGNCYDEFINGIQVQSYGPHTFHTNSEKVWKFITQYGEFKPYQLNTKAKYKDKIYSLPINLNTFYEFFGITTPDEAMDRVDEVYYGEIFKTLFEGYTLKQWGSINYNAIRRIPIRFTWDNNYFSDKYQGIPINGYTNLIKNILKDIPVELNTTFQEIPNWKSIAKKLIYTGPIDEYYNYSLGRLDYRSLTFKHTELKGDFQGCPIMNYTDINVPHTRIIEHKHFLNKQLENTIITHETPGENGEPYYPVNDDKNNNLYNLYKYNEDCSSWETDIGFRGRLGSYRYLNMDETIEAALEDR